MESPDTFSWLLQQPVVWLLFVWPLAGVVWHLRGHRNMVPAVIWTLVLWIPVVLVYDYAVKGRLELALAEIATACVVAFVAIVVTKANAFAATRRPATRWTTRDTVFVVVPALILTGLYLYYLNSLR